MIEIEVEIDTEVPAAEVQVRLVPNRYLPAILNCGALH